MAICGPAGRPLATCGVVDSVSAALLCCVVGAVVGSVQSFGTRRIFAQSYRCCLRSSCLLPSLGDTYTQTFYAT
eukprot:4208648-Prymnesium_polylepis.2